MNWKFFKKLLLLPDNVEQIQLDINELKKDHKEIRESLIARGLIRPYTKSQSPKQITERGHDLLNKNNINELLSSCDLLKEEKLNELKNKKEVEIFFKCFEWVKKHGKKKVFEIMYESNISEDQCIELVALAIRDKIFELIKQ